MSTLALVKNYQKLIKLNNTSFTISKFIEITGMMGTGNSLRTT